MKILVVDDERTALETLARGLRLRGHTPILAQNAVEALRHVCDPGRDVDLVITDYLMPGISGVELLKAIRSTHPLLPVIMVSGHGSSSMLCEALKHGFSGFIPKPFTPERLNREISRLFCNCTDAASIPD